MVLNVFLLCDVSSFLCVAQDIPTFNSESESAIVWGSRLPSGAVASIASDPLTGSLIKRFKLDGIEVSSTNGVSKRSLLAWGPQYSITVWITVVNNTSLPVRVGGFTSTLRVIEPKNLKKAGYVAMTALHFPPDLLHQEQANDLPPY